jgi:hypothetical protein
VVALEIAASSVQPSQHPSAEPIIGKAGEEVGRRLLLLTTKINRIDELLPWRYDQTN